MECIKTLFYETSKNGVWGASGSPLQNSKPTSLSTLVTWNITKAKETYPELNIKDAIATAQSRLEHVSDAHKIEAILSEKPYTRYLACALLAWQQLGHRNVESLCRFVENEKYEEEFASKLANASLESVSHISRESTFAKAVENSSFYSNEMGPVIKLPVETKIVMRARSGPVLRCPVESKPTVIPKNTIEKIEKACCRDSKVSVQLLELENSINELKTRVALLASRESNRIELIERAEAAWRDLELGYQRRHQHAEEKLTDIEAQINTSITERNSYKEDCESLSEQMKGLLEILQEDNNRLNAQEEELYNLACERVTCSQTCAKEDAVVSKHAREAAQLDRDLAFKEEKERRYLQNIQSELESVGAIAHEIDRTLRIELNTMRDQLSIVSQQLLAEDNETDKMKVIVTDLQQEKMGIMGDLESCKMVCDGRVQEVVEEIKSKSEKLSELNEKVLECRCKVPVDASIEVKRTPSLAALCRCTSSETLNESCSCTSVRGRLMSDVLATLFEGLRYEMGGIVMQMPCQLLKCLEDTHNWDKVSAVKSNLKNYFSKLLAGELEIAITTSIEDYHAKWVGTTCADEASPEAEIERRAKSMASKLAEQLFQEKSKELEQRARDILTSGPPPCNCQSQTIEPQITIANADIQSKDLPFLLKNRRSPSFVLSGSETPIYWHQAKKGVMDLHQQVKGLQKESLKKADLKTTEKEFMRRSPPKAGHSPSRNGEAERKERHGRSDVAGNHTAAFPSLAQNKPETYEAAGRGTSVTHDATSCETSATHEAAGRGTPVYWYKAMQDVTQLRKQVEGLAKDSLKKEDLKRMENKFIKIIERVSGSTPLPGARTDNLPAVNNSVNKAIKKPQKINRTVNRSYHPIDNINKPTPTQLNNRDTSSQIKKRSKLFLKHNIDKTFTTKRNNNIYAVNMCFCNAKKGQQISKDPKRSFEISSNIKFKPKPIKNYPLSQNISRRNSKESDTQSCPSNCACFNTIPSTTSIDKLLETLAKWKYDLDASDDKFMKKPSRDENISLKSEINDNTQVILQKKPATKHDSLIDQSSIPKIDLYDSYARKTTKNLKNVLLESKMLNNSGKLSAKSAGPIESIDSEYMGAKTQIKNVIIKHKSHDMQKHDQSSKSKIDFKKLYANKTSENSENISAKSTGPISTTESEYMGAINLDKSNEKLSKSVNDTKNNKTTSYKYFNSNKDSFEKDLEAIILERSHTKNEKHNKVSADRINKQDRRAKEMIVLKNIKKNKERSISQSHENDTNNKLNNVKTNANVVGGYQINFIGVTLADANPTIKNKVFHENSNDYINDKKRLVSNTATNKKSRSDKKKNSSESDLNEAYPVKNNGDYRNVNIAEYSRLSNSMKIGSTNILNAKNDHVECSNCDLENYQIITCPISKLPNQNEHYHNETNKEDEKFDEHRIRYDGVKRTKVHASRHKNNNKGDEHDNLKITTDQDTYNRNLQPGKDLISEIYSNIHECECPEESILEDNNLSEHSTSTKAEKNGLSEKKNESLNAASDNIEPGKYLVSKGIRDTYDENEDIMIDAKQSEPLQKHMDSCQCSVNLTDFKNFLDGNFGVQISNEDGFSDVQSLKPSKNKNDSCVCCKNLSTGDLKDIEQNAFHLLEEYLKNKLDEFKATHCSSLCIPPIEEEKLFNKILQKVKQVIADSTNQITCKCSAEGVKSQGSWNRAHGLLQEYLKMKIKKVQCSCLLAEDNKNSILPNVLDKVNNLIEYDFKRLKNVCRCKNDPYSQNNTKTKSKQKKFKAEIPEKVTAIYPQTKDNSILSNRNEDHAVLDPNGKNMNVQYNALKYDPIRSNTNQSQATAERNGKNLSTQASDHSLNKYKDCKCSDTNYSSELNQINEKLSQGTVVINGNNLKMQANINQGQTTVQTNGKNVYIQGGVPKHDPIRDNEHQGQTTVKANSKNFKMKTSAPKCDPICGNANHGEAILETNGINLNTQASDNSLFKYEDCDCDCEYFDTSYSSKLNQNNGKLHPATVETNDTNEYIQGSAPKYNPIRGNANQGDATVETNGKNFSKQASGHLLNKYRDCECSDITSSSKLNQNNKKLHLATVVTNGKNLKTQTSALKYDPIRDYDNLVPETVKANDKNVSMQASAHKYDPIRGNANQGDATLETNGKDLKKATGNSLNKFKYCKCSETITDAQSLPKNFNKTHESLGQATLKSNGENVKIPAITKYDSIHGYGNVVQATVEGNSKDLKKGQKLPAFSDLSNSEYTCLCKCGENIDFNVGGKVNDFLIHSFSNDNNIKNVSYIIKTNTITSVKNFEQTSECVSCNLEQKNVPYIGNTIDCCCGNSLHDTCVCSKSLISKANSDMLMNFWEKSMADESYLEKVSHTMDYQSAKMPVDKSEDVFLRSILKKNAAEASSCNGCQTGLNNSNTDEQFLLKKSLEYVDRINAKTNTLNDITSVGTNYSTNEDTMDYSECFQCNNNKNSDSERLKNSLCSLAHIGEYDDNLKNEPFSKDDYSVKSFNKLPKRECKCEMVPICHVKMLVENIETKLMTAKCTCDSLIPKVCPVHSTK